MVHRDIKPDNIALVDTAEGEMVKVLDFGIAKVKEARMGESSGLTLTGTGVVIGTPQYMSPEQAMGKRGDELDGRADLYSLGIVMYQMLTADLPFRADTTMEMLLAHMQKAPALIRETHPELQVPESVAALTMRLLEKNRDMRPASARVLIQEIEKIEQEMSSPVKTRILTREEVAYAGEGRPPSAGGRSPAAVGPARPPTPPVPPPPPAPAARTVEPPKPAPPAAVRPPVVVSPPLHAPPVESRWGLWVGLIVLLVGIGGGGLYIVTRRPAPSPESAPSSAPAANPNPTPPSTTTTLPAVTQTPATQPVANPTPPAPSPEATRQTILPTRKPRPTHTTQAPPVVTPPVPTVDAKAVRGKLNLGKFHESRGEYDEAIAALQEGLKLDPTNLELRQQLEKTIKACKTERTTMGENLKCGE
jgi:serine/threonine-protein kinase